MTIKLLRKLSRRQFIGTVGAGAVVAGCGAVDPILPIDPGPGNGPSSGGNNGGTTEPVDPVNPIDPVNPVNPGPVAPLDLKATLLSRTTFGATVEEQARYDELGYDGYLDEQLHPETIVENDAEIDALLAPLWTLTATPLELQQTNYAQAWHNVLPHLAKARLIRAVKSRRQLKERMVDFWLDHFNIQAAKTPYVRYQAIQYERDFIRPNALGKFRDLLGAVAKSPAMMVYLDGSVNYWNANNENYARELFELHTVGLNKGYGHQDIVNSARSFTGWRPITNDSVGSPDGIFQFGFVSSWHDPNSKLVMGMPIPSGGGIADGEMVLDHLASHPNTAVHIATRLLKAFVRENPTPAMIQRVADTFFETDGDIRETMREVLSYETLSEAAPQLKRPLHFVAGLLRQTATTIDSTKAIDQCLRDMGHYPYDWVTPDGYPIEKQYWAAGLLERWNFAFRLVKGEVAGFNLPLPAMLGPGVAPTIAQVVDYWDERYTMKRMTAHERQALIDYANNVLGGSASGDAELFGMFLTLPSYQAA